MCSLQLLLPWPTSTNALFVAAGKRRIKTRDYKAFGKLVGGYVLEHRIPRFKLRGRLGVAMRLYPPNKQKLDVDNRAKAVLDALTAAGVIGDDEQVDLLIMARGPIRRPPAVFVRIEQMEGLPPILDPWSWFSVDPSAEPP